MEPTGSVKTRQLVLPHMNRHLSLESTADCVCVGVKMHNRGAFVVCCFLGTGHAFGGGGGGLACCGTLPWSVQVFPDDPLPGSVPGGP